MTDRIATSANYADLKLIKTRSVAQVVLEIDISRAEEFIKAFGIPQPGKETPVAIALLDPEKAQEQPKDTARSEAAKKAYRDMSEWRKAATRAVMLCKDERFRDWLRRRQGNGLPLPAGEAGGEAAAYFLREACNIESRSEIATDERAYTAFIALEQEYRMATGQAAEVRG